MNLNELAVAGLVVVGAAAANEVGLTPAWVAPTLAAVMGSACSVGFRRLEKQIKGMEAVLVSFAGGAIGGYFIVQIIFGVANLLLARYDMEIDPGMKEPFVFFVSVFAAQLLKSLSTRVDFDGVADAIEDKIEEKVKKV